MPRRALLVGIDRYDHMPPLNACEHDVAEMIERLERHEDDRYYNYDCRTLVGSEQRVNRALLRTRCEELFTFEDKVLFYFSGHGTPTAHDGWLVTQDGEQNDPGLPMSELLDMANRSRARSVLLILDCCHSGELGNPPNLPERQAQLREGVTILAASRRFGKAVENARNGIFTQLILEALDGAAADIRGRVTAASIYAYVSRGLGPWDQRPLFKSHVALFPSVRRCVPLLEDVEIRALTRLFETPESALTCQEGDPRLQQLEKLRDAGLVAFQTAREERRPSAVLTPRGKAYWGLVDRTQI